MKPVWQLVRWSTIVLAIFFVSQDMCISNGPRFLHYPSILLLNSGLFVAFAFLAAIPAAFYFLVRCFLQRRDRDAVVTNLARAVVCIAFAAAFVAIVRWTGARRTAAFAEAATNGAPIIAALTQYRTDIGAYPGSLEQLVPKYIDTIPYTGLLGYPSFTYRKDFNDIKEVADSYELRIDCTSGGINFDRFIYWPSENYPKYIQGNRTEPIGSWVYVHE